MRSTCWAGFACVFCASSSFLCVGPLSVLKCNNFTLGWFCTPAPFPSQPASQNASHNGMHLAFRPNAIHARTLQRNAIFNVTAPSRLRTASARFLSRDRSNLCCVCVCVVAIAQETRTGTARAAFDTNMDRLTQQMHIQNPFYTISHVRCENVHEEQPSLSLCGGERVSCCRCHTFTCCLVLCALKQDAQRSAPSCTSAYLPWRWCSANTTIVTYTYIFGLHAHIFVENFMFLMCIMYSTTNCMVVS